MLIGCHVSIAKGLWNAPKRASDLGCETFQIFTRSPQGGKATKVTKEVIKKFKVEMKKHNFSDFYVHTPYYINLASKNNRIRYGSANAIKEELERADLLGAKYVMTHLGTSKELGQKKALQQTIKMLQKALEKYDGQTKLLLENSAGSGEIIGDSFSEIFEIIEGVNNKHIAGTCLDTQHSFASGYDWRTTQSFQKNIKKIDQELGKKYIKLIHANDSRAELGSKKDQHEHLGKGFVGKTAFQNFASFAEKENIDMILETKHDSVKNDIEFLKSIRKN